MASVCGETTLAVLYLIGLIRGSPELRPKLGVVVKVVLAARPRSRSGSFRACRRCSSRSPRWRVFAVLIIALEAVPEEIYELIPRAAALGLSQARKPHTMPVPSGAPCMRGLDSRRPRGLARVRSGSRRGRRGGGTRASRPVPPARPAGSARIGHSAPSMSIFSRSTSSSSEKLSRPATSTVRGSPPSPIRPVVAWPTVKNRAVGARRGGLHELPGVRRGVELDLAPVLGRVLGVRLERRQMPDRKRPCSHRPHRPMLAPRSSARSGGRARELRARPGGGS